MKFSDIPAHDSVKQQLVAMVDNNRIPHALLLEGKSGIGKMMLARAFAQYIHCTGRRDGDSCGVCPSCIQHKSFNHIDTHYSYPVIKLKNRSGAAISDDWAEQWRQFLDDSPYMDMNSWVELLGNANAQPQIFVDESGSLIRKLNFTSHAARFKIVLMWLPERMNEPCANKLLKLLEEPHDDTLFILVSNEPARILPTIYSRLRRIEVKRLSDETVGKYLTDHYGTDRDAAEGIARLAEGSILEAVRRLSTSDESRQFLEMFMSLMRLAYQKRLARCVNGAMMQPISGEKNAAGYWNTASVLRVKTTSTISMTADWWRLTTRKTVSAPTSHVSSTSAMWSGCVAFSLKRAVTLQAMPMPR